MRSDLFLNGFSLCWAEIEEDSYLHRVEALKEVESMDFHRPVTFFAGENGTGKSTLLAH